MTVVAESTDAVRAFKNAIVIDASVAPVLNDEYVAKLRRSGVTAINWTVCHPWPWIGAPLVPTLTEIAAGIEAVARYPEDLILVRSADDITRAKHEGKVAVIFGPQNARPAEEGFFVFRVLWE